MPRYAQLVYNGFWFAPERELLQTLVDERRAPVTGTARLKLYKGSVHRRRAQGAAQSLYRPDFATFEAETVYDQKDAGGFIKLNALRVADCPDFGLRSSFAPRAAGFFWVSICFSPTASILVSAGYVTRTQPALPPRRVAFSSSVLLLGRVSTARVAPSPRTRCDRERPSWFQIVRQRNDDANCP